MPRHKFQLMADGECFYLHDGDSEFDAIELYDLWTATALKRKLAVANGLIGVRTARSMYVPVEVEVRRDPPTQNLSRWDAVVESGILVPTGDLFVSGSAFLSDEQIEVAPGCYLARVYYGGLGRVTNGLEGGDQPLQGGPLAGLPPFRTGPEALAAGQALATETIRRYGALRA